MVGRKKISRKKPSEKSYKNYFDDNTQQAIVNYQNQTNDASLTDEEKIKRKNAIFIAEIMPAFDSLVENLINVYGFHVNYESKDDLKNECLEFLYGIVLKFDNSKNSRAFSYFNVCAKHWLTIKSKQNAKATQTYISLDDKDALSTQELERMESQSILPSCDEIVTEEEVRNNLVKIVQLVADRVKSDNEVLCMEAIDLLVKNIDNIDLLSKRAVLTYVREITGLNSKQLSIVLSSIKKHYRDIRKGFNNETK